MTIYACEQCNYVYPEIGLPHLCPQCGGVFKVSSLPSNIHAEADPSLPGLWKYKASFGLPADAPISYLGEGNTPLLPISVAGRTVHFKLESLNPSGSFKDRGTAVLISALRERGIEAVLEDSSGNAGASLAQYCAANGIASRIFVPASASGPKLRQMQRARADLVSVAGERENAHRAVVREVEESGIPYASHALQPFGLTGIATIAYELYEQLGKLPGTIIAPIGHGSLFTGIYLGVEALRAGLGTRERVKMIGVQPENCAPLAAAWHGKTFGGITGPSLAEGTQIASPSRMRQILAMLNPDVDAVIAINEPALRASCLEMAAMGIYVEPTSALVWAAYKALIASLVEPVVMIISGSGLKFSE